MKGKSRSFSHRPPEGACSCRKSANGKEGHRPGHAKPKLPRQPRHRHRGRTAQSPVQKQRQGQRKQSSRSRSLLRGRNKTGEPGRTFWLRNSFRTQAEIPAPIRLQSQVTICPRGYRLPCPLLPHPPQVPK